MMTAETTFDVVYLVTIWTLIALMTLRAGSVAPADLPVARRIRWAFAALGTGDLGHVRFRILAELRGGLVNNAVLLGAGAAATLGTYRWLPPLILLLVCSAAPARAQCGADASSCLSCHEVQHQKSILSDGRSWHVDHGFGDLCARCHGGRPDAADKEGAHQGRVDPLSEPERICGACHGTSAAAYADRYARLRIPLVKGPKQESGPVPGRGAGSRSGNIALAIAAALLAAGGILFIRYNEGRRRRRSVPASAIRWSAYGAGAALGVVVAISMAVFGHPLGASGAFLNLAGSLARRIAPGALYFRDLMPTGITWQVWVILGLFVGAFIGAATRRELALRAIPDREWISAFGPSRAKRWAIAFLSAALIEFAAGIAGGCTSGLAISGGVVMAPGAFLFMMAMFATGIPTARILFRNRGRQEESP